MALGYFFPNSVQISKEIRKVIHLEFYISVLSVQIAIGEPLLHGGNDSHKVISNVLGKLKTSGAKLTYLSSL